MALALEDEGFVVSGALKFPVKVRTSKAAYEEWQTHGFEVDLVGARSDRLVLATVKSFFGSRGVVAEHVRGDSDNRVWNAKYAVINNRHIRDGVVAGAATRFGYDIEQVELRLYVGKFAGAGHESAVRAWCAGQVVGVGPVVVVGASQVVDVVRAVASSKTYRDSAVLASLKVLDAAGALRPMDSPAAVDASPYPDAGRSRSSQDDAVSGTSEVFRSNCPEHKSPLTGAVSSRSKPADDQRPPRVTLEALRVRGGRASSRLTRGLSRLGPSGSSRRARAWRRTARRAQRATPAA